MGINIISMIKKGEYEKALVLIEDMLKSSELDEDKHCELMQERVTIKTLMGRKDEYIADLVKKEKHPSMIEYLFDSGHIIILQMNNQFRTPCDAYVNLTHPEKFFNGGTGSKEEFVKRIGLPEIKSQLSNYKNLKEGDFIILCHPDLSAPKSYHILFDHEDHIDEKNLALGIKRVLDDAVKNNLELISFFPLGYGTVMRAPEEKKEQIKADITSSSIYPIVEYFFNNMKRKIPKISFNFINADTMYAYNKVVYSLFNMKMMAKIFLQNRKTFPTREKNLLDATITLDPKYVNTLKELASIALDYDDNILLTGETGVGKSFLARVIHDNSRRAGKPFEKMNLGLLRPNWVYVELFGARKGAYTDCKEDREGAIGRAEGGTLFLDEIGHADFDTQKMLLQFLDDGTYRWLGDKRKELRKADVRIILGTNSDLEEKILRQEFLSDLYERIAQGSQFILPPLRDRKDDIAFFADYIIDKLNKEKNCNLKLSEEARKLLLTYKWPGNIRQLKSYVEYLHNKSIHMKQKDISEKLINDKPPRDYLYQNPTSFESLESSLASFIKNWDENYGKINKDLVEPILAKVYLDDLKLNKTNAIDIIGIDGTGGKKGPLNKRYEHYKIIKSRLNNSH